MTGRRPAWLALAVVAAALLAVAGLDDGADPTAEERVQALQAGYACPVCDGQAVSESNAPVAATIREFIRTEVARGSTDTEIRDSLIDAYGGEVLLTPPSDGVSVALWVLPVVALAGGGAAVWALVGQGGSGSATRRATIDDEPARPRRSPGRVAPVVVGVLVIGAGAGWVLAQVAGERGVGDGLTGEIAESPRQLVARCQELAATGDSLVPALECFDDVLAQDPTNTEALTYRGWYVVLAANSATASGDEATAGELVDVGLRYLDDAVAVDPTYPDARAFRAVVYSRQGRTDEACAELAELEALDPPEMMLELTAGIRQAEGCG